MATFTLTEDTHLVGPQGEIMGTLRPIKDGTGFEVELSHEPMTVTKQTLQGEHGQFEVFRFEQGEDSPFDAEVAFGIY